MARRETITLVDDLDGTEATQRVPFALDGIRYEIDLNDTNADRLRGALRIYAQKGRRTGGRKQRTQANPANATTTATREQTGIDAGALRIWANDNGFNLSGRGRIPAAVVEAYREAHEATTTSTGKRARKTTAAADAAAVPTFSDTAEPPRQRRAATPPKVAARKAAAKTTAKGKNVRGRARS